MLLRVPALLFWLVAGAITPSFAANDLGSAGPFRLVGGGVCSLGHAAQRSGACDPASVDSNMPHGTEKANARIERAKRLLGLVRIEAAQTELDDAIKEEPHHIAALHLRARMRISHGDFEAARLDLLAANITSNPDGGVMASLAYVELQRQRLSEAVRHADRAVRVKPNDPDVRWIRAQVALAAGQTQEALQNLDLALEDRGNFRARLSRAQIFLRDLNFAAAIADADKLLAAMPADYEARNIRALARLGAGQLEGALDDLSSMIGPPGGPYLLPPRHPDFGRMSLERAMLLVRAGRTSDAAKDIQYVLTQGGPSSILRLQLFLRENGFPDIALDGNHNQKLDDAIVACFISQACGRGLTAAI